MNGGRLRLTILGCGSSPGVPRINGDWGACDPDNPKNRRFRASALVERIGPNGTTRVVIDTGPDFRSQMIAAKAERLDGVVYTHGHADHIHGVDDLRGYVLAQRQMMHIHADRTTLERLRQSFTYCFETPQGSSYPPILIAHEIEPDTVFHIDGEGGALAFEPLPQLHGENFSLGFRIGPLAYCTDVSGFPDTTALRLRGLEALVIDALQYRPHPSHLSLGEALDWIARLAPKQAYLTHMHTPLDHATVNRETPAHVSPAHDGLAIETNVPEDWS
ncbi:MAG: MBL fold metallo-hydrolase [Rhizobiaceae bacterium]